MPIIYEDVKPYGKIQVLEEQGEWMKILYTADMEPYLTACQDLRNYAPSHFSNNGLGELKYVVDPFTNFHLEKQVSRELVEAEPFMEYMDKHPDFSNKYRVSRIAPHVKGDGLQIIIK